MNTKLVIVWIIAVIIFAGIGLFGMANQHLLDEPDPVLAPTNPSGNTTNTTHSVNCIASLPNGTSTYSFTVDDATSSVTNVAITYQATTAVDYIHSSALNLSSMQVSGVVTNLSGSIGDFVLQINANVQNFDSQTLSNYQQDLSNVSALIVQNNSVDNYQAAINNIASSYGSVYNCS